MEKSRRPSRSRAGFGLVGTSFVAVLAAACGGGGGSSSAPGASAGVNPPAQASIAAELPKAIKDNVPLQIATDATYEPNEFVDVDTSELKGWDVDLAKAICHVWGVTCTISNVTFGDIIPAMLEAKPKYVLSLSSFTPTEAREMKGIDFVTYYKAGESWLVKTGGPSISKATDLCGHSVAVESTTTEESDAYGLIGQMPGGEAISGDTDNCKAAGKADVTVQSFDTQTEADAALLSGRSDFGWADSPVAGFQVKLKNGQIKLAGSPCGVAPYGIAMTHASGLQQAVSDAVKYMIDHGYYKKILDNWNVGSGAITSADVGVNGNSITGAGTEACVPAY